MSQTTAFDSQDALRAAYNIKAELSIGEASFVQFIKHPILARESQDSLVDVQVGTLSGNTFTAYPDIAARADELIETLTNYLDHGDHDGLMCISLLSITNEGYRIFAEPSSEGEYEPIEYNADSIDELLALIK